MKFAVALVAVVMLAILSQGEAQDADKAEPIDIARPMPVPLKCPRYCQISCPNGYCDCVVGCERHIALPGKCYHRKCCSCRCASGTGDAHCRTYRRWWCPYPIPYPVKEDVAKETA